jgi:hypothetical protein
MTLPPGWIPNNFAPGERNSSYTGDPTSGWEAGVGGATGLQPKSANNPEGTLAGVPAMAITLELATYLAGDPTAAGR